MIEIKITCGLDTAAETLQLRKLAAALLALAGDSAAPENRRQVGDKLAVPYGGPVAGNGAPGWTIAPNDVPDVGADPEPEIDPAAVFGEADPDPAQVFGAGNAAAGSATASSPSPALSAAALPALSGNGSAAASGDAGNGQGASSPTPNGTPAALNSGAVTGGVQIDSRGLPWDVRIHASTKTTNKDLTWKKKPNVDPALVAQVEAELRAVMAIQVQGNAAAGAPATPPAAVVPPPPPASAPGNVQTIPTPPPLPAITGGVAGSSITGFAQLLSAVTNGIAGGTLTEQRVADVLAQYGCAVLPQIAPRPDLVALVAAALFPVQ